MDIRRRNASSLHSKSKEQIMNNFPERSDRTHSDKITFHVSRCFYYLSATMTFAIIGNVSFVMNHSLHVIRCRYKEYLMRQMILVLVIEYKAHAIYRHISQQRVILIVRSTAFSMTNIASIQQYSAKQKPRSNLAARVSWITLAALNVLFLVTNKRLRHVFECIKTSNKIFDVMIAPR